MPKPFSQQAYLVGYSSPFMRLAEHLKALRGWCKQSAWWVKTRRASSRPSRDARVYGRSTTAMHSMSTPAPTPSLKGLPKVSCSLAPDRTPSDILETPAMQLRVLHMTHSSAGHRRGTKNEKCGRPRTKKLPQQLSKRENATLTGQKLPNQGEAGGGGGGGGGFFSPPRPPP